MQTDQHDLHFLPDDKILVDYEKSVITISRRRVLKILFQSELPIAINQILQSANISLNSLVAIYTELRDHDFVTRSDSGFQLTKSGRIWVLKNRKDIFMRKTKVIYKEVQLNNRTNEKLTKRKKLPDGYLFTKIDLKINIR